MKADPPHSIKLWWFYAALMLLGASFFYLLSYIPLYTISDVSKTSFIPISRIYRPKCVAHLITFVKNTKGPLALAGGRYSQGGQIGYPNGITIDMTALNKVVAFDPVKKLITVQAGMRWSALQKYIDPYDLSVQIMQSYNDFTIGGSLSVNVHGRDICCGPLIESVESIKVLLADGSIVHASRIEHADLLNAIIGGYGGLGIIVEVTLRLTTNQVLERRVVRTSADQYAHHFLNTIRTDPSAVLHNANLYPPALNQVISITWHTSDKAVTQPERLQPQRSIYLSERLAEVLLRRIPFGRNVRASHAYKVLNKPAVHYRNYEMSSSVNTLGPLFRWPNTTILQEYFIPVTHIAQFIDQLRNITLRYHVHLLNVSLRYVPKNTESLLTYSPNDSFALVLYISIFNTYLGKIYTKRWTQELIDQALALGGTYYLPYQLYATPEQLHTAYPEFDHFLQIKTKYDPENKFSNMFFKTYGH